MPKKRTRYGSRVLTGELLGKVGARKAPRRSAAPFPPTWTSSTFADQQKKLLTRIKAAEETLEAIQSGEVDAFMVSGRRGPQVVTLAGGEPAYRMLVEAMSEGAAMVSRKGAVLYCNGRFADLVGWAPAKVIGMSIASLLPENERNDFKTLIVQAQERTAKGEFSLRRRDGNLVPVYLSLNRLRPYGGHVLGMVITDLSEQKRKQAAETLQTATMRRLLLIRTFSAQEEEKRRIARELHDETGQLLTSLLVGLRTLEVAKEARDFKVQGAKLCRIAAKAIEEIGRVARGLHPALLEDHGLGVALQRYLADYTQTHKITAILRLKGLESCHLPQAVQIRLYRILQEALTNVARHSGAKKVSLIFTHSGADLRVTVIDDGCGFDAKKVLASSHRLGIVSMRERAGILGGTVTFKPRDKGTTVLIQIPLSQPRSQKPGGGVTT